MKYQCAKQHQAVSVGRRSDAVLRLDTSEHGIVLEMARDVPSAIQTAVQSGSNAAFLSA
jgi:hypothetical protein